MTSTNLITALGIGRIPQVDFDVLLHWCFTGARIDPQEPFVSVHSTDAGDALRVVYNRAGDIVDLVPLQYWSENLFQGLKQEIDREAAGGPTKIRRSWAFASVPTTGSWRYRDMFQICGPPANAPSADQLAADHPLVLEVAFASSEHGVLNIDRVATRRKVLGVFAAVQVAIPRPPASVRASLDACHR